MHLIFYFLVALILSFLGSLPIGLITLTITQKTIEKGMRAGLLIALGASVMEFGYTYLALMSLELFTENLAFESSIKIVAITVFMILAIYYYFKKPSSNLQPSSTYDYFDFFRGVVVGLMNVLILPFWIFLGIWLVSNGMDFNSQPYLLIFSFGATIGAFLAFLGYIWGSKLIEKKVVTLNQYTNKIVSVLFFGLGIFQLIQLW